MTWAAKSLLLIAEVAHFSLGLVMNEAIRPQRIAAVTPPEAEVNAPVRMPLTPPSDIAYSVPFAIA